MSENESRSSLYFERAYTPEEAERNKQLYKACREEVLDRRKIEALLKQGADPLGGTAVSGLGLTDHIYGELLGDLSEEGSDRLPWLTELFLQYGMDIDHPRIPYDDENSVNPMWDFAFSINEHSVHALKLLLDHGLSAESAGMMWTHAVSDGLDVVHGDPNCDPFWNYTSVWTMKMLMLCASYDHILNNDPDLRWFIGRNHNSYDLHEFRRWNDFTYVFDTSLCEDRPELYHSIVRSYEKESGREVWRFGIGFGGAKV